MKYLACIEAEIFNEIDESKIASFLVEKKLFEIKEHYTLKNGTIDLSSVEKNIVITPTQDLKDEFYNYILNHFNEVVIEIKHDFYDDFNEEVYGLDLKEQKTIALKHFKKIYSDISIKNLSMNFEKVSDNGIVHTYKFEKIKMLYGQQRAHKTNLALTDTLEHYLTGNQAFFDSNDLFKQYQIIEDLLYFEIWKQVLIELNDRFGFEEDYYFTNIIIDIKNFNKYKHIFKSLKSYQFTDRKIRSFKKDIKAHLESLYEALQSQEVIKDNKTNFMTFLKEEYEISITKIVSYHENKNYTNDERVKLFTQEWKKLTSKN